MHIAHCTHTFKVKLLILNLNFKNGAISPELQIQLNKKYDAVKIELKFNE